jgi:hypothetical protein
MSHRPLTNTSSLKIAAAYWIGLSEYKIADAKKILNVASFFYFNFSSPSDIATCTALHEIRRFRRQYCSRCSNSDKYTLLLYFLKFYSLKEIFLEVEDCFM